MNWRKSSRWRKSRHSLANGNCVEVADVEADADWRTARESMSNGNCVEVAAPGAVLVRDTADRSGPVLGFTGDVWAAFLGAVKGGAA